MRRSATLPKGDYHLAYQGAAIVRPGPRDDPRVLQRRPRGVYHPCAECELCRSEQVPRGRAECPDPERRSPRSDHGARSIISSPLCCRCQVVAGDFLEAAGERSARRCSASFGCIRAVPGVALGLIVVAGPGVACPKCRCAGCEPAALDAEWFPGCPPGLLAHALAARRASATSAA